MHPIVAIIGAPSVHSTIPPRLMKLATSQLLLHTPLRSYASSANEHLVTPVLKSRGTWLQKNVCSPVSSRLVCEAMLRHNLTCMTNFFARSSTPPVVAPKP